MLTINIGSLANPWTLRHRVKGTSTWVTNNVTPANPQLSTNTSATITTSSFNTIYEYQVLTLCNGSTSQSVIATAIDRSCPTLLQNNVVTTDTSINLSFPLNTPAPISNHISSIFVELYQGLTLITSQTLSSLNTTNAVTFTGLNQNTSYKVKYTINFTASDNPLKSSYPSGVTANTHICEVNVMTDVSPVCPTPIIISFSQN
jgi:hypothetical protein